MRRLYRLSFNNRNQWVAKRNQLVQPDEDGNYSDKSTETFTLLTGEPITVVEVGEVPTKVRYDKDGNLKPPNYLDKDGNLVNVKHTDFAVDVISDVEIPELNKYAITNEWYQNSFTGGFQSVEPQPVQPDSSWSKSEIKKYLDDKNIEYKKTATKSALLDAITTE